MLFSSIIQKLSHLTERQNLIASNIANANTPNFVTKDLHPFSLEKQKKSLLTTNNKHISFPNNKINAHVYTPNNTDKKLNGNDVIVENEMLKLSETNLQHKQVTGLYKVMAGILKNVVTNK